MTVTTIATDIPSAMRGGNLALVTPERLAALEATETAYARLREAILPLMPPREALDLYASFAICDFEGIEPYYVEKWKLWLVLEDVLRVSLPGARGEAQ